MAGVCVWPHLAATAWCGVEVWRLSRTTGPVNCHSTDSHAHRQTQDSGLYDEDLSRWYIALVPGNSSRCARHQPEVSTCLCFSHQKVLQSSRKVLRCLSPVIVKCLVNFINCAWRTRTSGEPGTRISLDTRCCWFIFAVVDAGGVWACSRISSQCRERG